MIVGHFANYRSLFVIAIATSMLSLPQRIQAQEAVRDLNDASQAAKYLTPGEIDSWVFDGTKNETLVVRVSTQQFDPVIGLARVDGNSEQVLFSVDDKGSTSQFSFRLPDDGVYKIRVHGFEMKGGGNYDLAVQRFLGRPLEIGQTVNGTFDRSGQAVFYFKAKRDDNLTVSGKGPRQNSFLDPKGNSMHYHWPSKSVLLIEKDGEHLVKLTGKRGVRYSLQIQPATRASLALNDKLSTSTTEKSMRVWDIDAQPGQFRLISVTRSNNVSSRLIYAPVETNPQKLLDQEKEFAELQLIPVSSKGDLTRYVAVFGRKGRYQLQTYTHANHDINVEMVDPTITINRGEQSQQRIPIGGTDFYGFQAKAGDLIQAKLDSNDFDCVIRLFDSQGQLVTQNDDSRDSKNSQIKHMVTRNGSYRWQIGSLGNGGGGEYRIEFDEIKLKQLTVANPQRSTLFTGGTEYWSLEGKKGQRVYLNVQSDDFDPQVAIYGPDGYRYDHNDSGGIGESSLLAIELPATGRFTVWVSSRRDGGNYRIRVLDAAWE